MILAIILAWSIAVHGPFALAQGGKQYGQFAPADAYVDGSRLTNTHTHQCFDGALFCYNQKCSFGLLTFDTTRPDPKVVYQIVNIDGQVMETLKPRKSQLVRTR